MKPKVYLETTIASYLAAWPSRDLVVAAHQEITHRWWRTRRGEFDLFVSEVVLREASAGDKEAAARRLAVLADIPSLHESEASAELAQELMSQIPLPPQALRDAFHIAVAVVNGMDYLLTWNCAHIANATWRGRLERICHARGYEPPVICTPEELLGE